MSGFNLSALAVRERAVTLFLIVALVAIGAFSYANLGRAEDPPFTVKTFTVIATWPGATAQEMQDLVADPLEKRMQELQWYDRVETYTRPGLAALEVTLRDTTPPQDVPEQFYQARKKLGDAAHLLPEGVQGPFINDEYSDVDFTVYALEGHGLPERQLVRVAETIRQRLLHVPGVRKVDIMGERPERVFVEFDYARLATLSVAPQAVFAALSRQNAVTPAGSIDTSGPQMFLRLDGALDDLQAIRETPIVSGGRSLHLSDIATVRRGYEDPPTLLVRHDGEPSLVLNVVMTDGWNGLTLGHALRAEEAKLAAGLPVGVTLTKVINQAAVIEMGLSGRPARSGRLRGRPGLPGTRSSARALPLRCRTPCSQPGLGTTARYVVDGVPRSDARGIGPPCACGKPGSGGVVRARAAGPGRRERRRRAASPNGGRECTGDGVEPIPDQPARAHWKCVPGLQPRPASL